VSDYYWGECRIGKPEHLREHIDDEMRERYEAFDIQGSGLLFVGHKVGSRCGTAFGFSIAPSFGKYGTAGGVIDAAEARRLADHIYTALGLTPLSSAGESLK
jgi:hypothetical protein